MDFFKCIKPFNNEIKVGQIIVDSHYHWQRTIIVADSKNKTIFLNFKLSGTDIKDENFFIPLSMKELNKIRPHLLKTLIIDLRHSFNKDCLSKLTKYCCYKCGRNTFGTNPKIKTNNTIGKCNNCGTEKQELFSKEIFKIDIFEKN